MGRSVAAIILAAGQGTRMNSTKAKVLHPVLGRPMIDYPIGVALQSGASPVALVIGHQAEEVRAHATRTFGDRVQFQVQTERLGTGHAAREGIKSLQGFDGLVLILSGDVPLLTATSLEKVLDAARQPQCTVGLLSARVSDPTGYGRIVRAGAAVARIVEHKDASPAERAISEINAGVYAVSAAFLREALADLSNDNAQGEYYLTDIIAMAIAGGHTVQAVTVDDPIEVAGANNRAQLAELETALRARINRRHMLAGVSLQDPTTTFIGPEVVIGQDTTLAPGVHLRGRTEIGRDCFIDVGAVVDDSKIGDQVRIHPYTVMEQADVRTGAVAGPFARLRPGAELLEGAKVGNFVEMKKSRLGPGAKANHLTYLGDADVGEGANIGAGTITCNYDGYGKYRTEIGRNVFVGSNATLVAPVAIGDDAYVAAGSVVTEEIGPADVAFGRARQVNKPGRAPELRDRARAAAEGHKRR